MEWNTDNPYGNDEEDNNKKNKKKNKKNDDNKKPDSNNNDFPNPYQNQNNLNENTNNNNNNNNNYNFNPYNDKYDDIPNYNEGDFSNPFGNQNNNNNLNNNNNNEFSNPFGNDFNNNNNNKNFVNPFSNNNNNNNDDFSNPFKNDFNDNNNQNFNPYENKKNPYDQSNFNNNKNLPSFQNFNEQSSNPYSINNNNSNFNNNNFNNFNGNNNFNNQNNNNQFGSQARIQNQVLSQDDTSNEQDFKKIKAIIDKCQLLFNEAKSQYDSYNVKEALNTLCKSIRGLDNLKNTINNHKKVFVAFLPQINGLRNKSFSNLQEYRIMVYKLINIRFKPVLYRPYDDNEKLIDFCARYILNKSFISFDDIYENNSIENKNSKNILCNNINQAQKTGNKCLLLYGPRGCGKTLMVHALADHLGAKIAQIEGLELFKIPFFSREFIKACFASLAFKPLIIYMKNIEKMSSAMNNFNFIYDKVASSLKLNVYFIASSSINVYNIPKSINDKFQFFQFIKPVDKDHRSDYIRFICNKIGIEIHMNDQDLHNFSIENLNNFSNEDIFDFIKHTIEIKKQKSPPDDENWVYREGLNFDDLKWGLGTVRGSLTDEVLKHYYL